MHIVVRMARKTRTITEYIDDLDNKPAGEDEITTVDFTVNKKSYRLDLREANLAKFEKALAPFIAAASVVAGSRSAATTRKPSSSGLSKDELANVRTWAGKNGHEVSPRGRIPKSVLDAYEDAHK